MVWQRALLLLIAVLLFFTAIGELSRCRSRRQQEKKYPDAADGDSVRILHTWKRRVGLRNGSASYRHHIVVASSLSRITTSSLLEHIEWLKHVERAGRTRCCRPLRAAPGVAHVDAGIETAPFISWRRC
jgi:hypothetical protein